MKNDEDKQDGDKNAQIVIIVSLVKYIDTGITLCSICQIVTLSW